MFELFETETHTEYSGEGCHVTIQHCEYQNSDGMYCNEYLGVNYPAVFCRQHTTRGDSR